jgi:hypothetical protein
MYKAFRASTILRPENIAVITVKPSNHGKRDRKRERDRLGKRVMGDTIYYMEAENFTALIIMELCTPVCLVKQFGGRAEFWKMDVKRKVLFWFE